METNKLRAYIIDNEGNCREENIDYDFGRMEKIIGCNILCMPTRCIDRVRFFIVMDDLSYYDQKLKPSYVNAKSKETLYGVLIFLGCDEIGNFVSLTDEQIDILKKHEGIIEYQDDQGNIIKKKAIINN